MLNKYDTLFLSFYIFKVMNLDQKAKIKSLDKSNCLGSIKQLYLQCRQTWQDIEKIKINKSYKKVENIVVNGMGGSSLGTHVIESLFFDELKIPLITVRGYKLPKFVNKNTLFIASSYSGNTEEVLAGVKEAAKRKAKVLGITSGGKLLNYLKRKNLPFYKIKADFNPSGQPRMALGYSILGQMGLLKKAGLIKISDADVKQLALKLEKLNKIWGLDQPQKTNNSKKLAKIFQNKIINIVSAEHLVGNSHILANQFNETAKNFANYFEIPELNHHLLEGLTHPKNNKKNLVFFFIESNLCFNKTNKRFKLTEDVVGKNGINFQRYKTKSYNKFEEVFEVLLLGSYISFYLAMLNGIDPAKIPWVDYFKNKFK